MSVSEFRWDFSIVVRCQPIHRCAYITPSLLRPRKNPCQFGEKCSSPPFRNRFSHRCCEKTFPKRAEDVKSSCAQQCRSRCRLSSVRCMVCGMLVVRAPTQTPTPFFARVYTHFLADFVISSTPTLSSLRGPHRMVRRRDAHKEDLRVRSNVALPCACFLLPVPSLF